MSRIDDDYITLLYQKRDNAINDLQRLYNEESDACLETDKNPIDNVCKSLMKHCAISKLQASINTYTDCINLYKSMKGKQ